MSYYAPPEKGTKDLRRIITANTNRKTVIITPNAAIPPIVFIGRKYHRALTISVIIVGTVKTGIFIVGKSPIRCANDCEKILSIN